MAIGYKTATSELPSEPSRAARQMGPAPQGPSRPSYQLAFEIKDIDANGTETPSPPAQNFKDAEGQIEIATSEEPGR